MSDPRAKQLAEFVAYAKTLEGDEKGEAQVFLDRLFRAFSRGGYKEAGAKLEERVTNERGGTSFADLVWKPVVLIEMKRRGEDLSRHLKQAVDYWIHLVPNRPAYVVLCNFDEFRVYDFRFDINKPQDVVKIDELPERYGPLNFLWPTNERPMFRVDREKVTREAADLLAAVYRSLKGKPGVGAPLAQRFTLQALVCLFSEDIGLLPKHFFTQLLDECVDPPKAFDLMDGLFRAMNSKDGARGGRFANVPYFNGGIFAHSAAVELSPQTEVAILRRAATYNWADVSPDIFGTIFQHSMDQEERHAFGAHYTTQEDILRIVKPTIVDPFTMAIERADSLKELNSVRDRLTTLRVLDPACGSGNFLYMAYREMRLLEAMIVAKESELSKRTVTGQSAFGHVSPAQFFGMDILPFAVELAKVTLSIAPKLASDELHTGEKTLPLDNLDRNIVAKDALIADDGTPAVWPKADVIIGNPPFLGAKRLKPERGAEYVNKVRKAYPDVPGMADYCVYWLRRSHDHLPAVTAADPFAGRAGLVGTQNIRNNQSRVGGLDHIAKSGTIVEAVENMPWSGEANVHVSIANWVKRPAAKASEYALLIPSPRKLWSRVDPKIALFDNGVRAPNVKVVTRGKRGKVRQDKSYEMAMRECDTINSALSDSVNASDARVLNIPDAESNCYTGQYPRYEGFMLAGREARRLLAEDPANAEIVHPFLVGRELLDDWGGCDRFVIDFQTMPILIAKKWDGTFGLLERKVLPYVKELAEKERKRTALEKGQDQTWLKTWWQHFRPRPELIGKIARLSRYIVCSRVTKRPIFVFLSPKIRPGDALSCFTFEDDYSFAILQSNAHWQWFIAKCSKLKSDFRYTPESVFDTFPWPQSPTKKQIRAVAAAGRAVRTVRDTTLPTIKGGLRALYRTLELPGDNPLRDAHNALDKAVLDAYGFSQTKDILKQLLNLNQSVDANIRLGKAVTGPGVPCSYGDVADLITEDCVKP
ncbi:MAG TPA: DNA methyltransferase [Phycisphaerales bacterium]|nr:DNA methyltransferase [Phycisphaerales bacterium]